MTNKMKLSINTEKCIGCGSCASVCPSVFELGSDNKVHFSGNGESKNGKEEKEIEEIECIKEAIDICPVQAIEKR